MPALAFAVLCLWNEFGGGGLPPLQQHLEPGRHRARLQGCRGLDHRGLVERVLAQLAKPCCAARLSHAIYYIYALDYDRGGEWSGQAFMCSRDKEFTIKGTENCLARGFDRTGFFEVDTGEQRAWTVQLTESNEQPARSGCRASRERSAPAGPETFRALAGRDAGLPNSPGSTAPGASGLPPAAAPGTKP